MVYKVALYYYSLIYLFVLRCGRSHFGKCLKRSWKPYEKLPSLRS